MRVGYLPDDVSDNVTKVLISDSVQTVRRLS